MIGSILGAGMQIGGSFMAANAASRRKRQLEAIANLPGLKMGDVYGDVSGSQGQAEGIEKIGRAHV